MAEPEIEKDGTVKLDNGQCVEKEKVDEIKKIFDTIDTDASGSISIPEMKVFFNALGEWSEGEFQSLFSSFDKNSDGVLSLKEFMTWMWYPDEEEDPDAKKKQVAPFLVELKLWDKYGDKLQSNGMWEYLASAESLAMLDDDFFMQPAIGMSKDDVKAMRGKLVEEFGSAYLGNAAIQAQAKASLVDAAMDGSLISIISGTKADPKEAAAAPPPPPPPPPPSEKAASPGKEPENVEKEAEKPEKGIENPNEAQAKEAETKAQEEEESPEKKAEALKKEAEALNVTLAEILKKPIEFTNTKGKSKLLPAGLEVLKEVGEALKKHPNFAVICEGHARGGMTENNELRMGISEERALLCKTILKDLGCPNPISTAGYGSKFGRGMCVKMQVVEVRRPVSVKVTGASKLKNHLWSGKLNPYCVVKLDEDKQARGPTHTSGNQNPVWDGFEFHQEWAEEPLTIQVWHDNGAQKAGTLIGVTTLLMDSKGFTGEKPVFKERGSGQPITGNVIVNISFPDAGQPS